MRISPRTPLALALAGALVLASCAGSDGATSSPDVVSPSAEVASADPGDGLTVVATTSILGDIVSNVVGDAGTVEVLMGPGVDPHSFQASAAQAASLRQADLVVANGLQLEESLGDTLDAALEDGASVVYVAEELDPIPFQGADGHDDGEEAPHGEDDHEELDPHVWLDPQRMAAGVQVIAEAIAQVDDTLPDADWQARGEAGAQEIERLDAEVEDILAVVAPDRRELVTNHDSLEYFAQRYDFDVVGTVIPGTSTQVDTSAESFTQLAEVLDARDVSAIFTDAGTSDRLATALVEETGRDVDVVVLYTGALGEPGSGAETYVDLMRFNAEAIATALG